MKIRSRRYPDVIYERTDKGVIVRKAEREELISSPKDFDNHALSRVMRTELIKVFQHRELLCEECGKPFTSFREESRFCSLKCQQQHYRGSKIKESMSEARTCEVCGKPVPKGRRTFCSEECALKAKRAGEKSVMRELSKPKDVKKKLTRKQKEKRFRETVEAANRAGLSYGQYRALQSMEEYGRIEW